MDITNRKKFYETKLKKFMFHAFDPELQKKRTIIYRTKKQLKQDYKIFLVYFFPIKLEKNKVHSLSYGKVEATPILKSVPSQFLPFTL